jgi:hypothetical protein
MFSNEHLLWLAGMSCFSDVHELGSLDDLISCFGEPALVINFFRA